MKSTAEEFGYRMTWGAMRAFFVALLVGWIVLIAANAVIDHFGWRSFDATDNASTGDRSGLRIYHDHGTGCDYLATRSGELTPRLSAAGKPICAASGIDARQGGDAKQAPSQSDESPSDAQGITP